MKTNKNLQDFEEGLNRFSKTYTATTQIIEKAIKELKDGSNKLSKERKQALEGILAKNEKELEELDKKKNEYEKLFNELDKVETEYQVEQLLNGKRQIEDIKKQDSEHIDNKEEALERLLAIRKKYTEGIGKVDDDEQKISEKYLGQTQEKWGAIEKSTKEISDLANSAMSSMFGATTKHLEQEKAKMTEELAELTKKIATAQKEMEIVKKRSAEQLAKEKEEYLKADIDPNDPTANVKVAAKKAELDELEKLYGLEQELKDVNEQHKDEEGYIDQELTDNQLARFDQLKAEHGAYAQSLDT